MTNKKNTSAVTISFPNPIEVVIEMLDSIKIAASNLLEEINTSTRQERIRTRKFFNPSSFSKFNFNKKNALQVVVPVLIVVILAFAVVAIFKKSNNGPRVAGVATSNNTEVRTFPINREFKFPLKDSMGKQVGTFTYHVKSAELRHQIIIKGQSASAVAGRAFLIINLQLDNSLNQGLQINTRDYIRVSVNGDNNQWFAPDIHNDPVEAQAISTTNTRLGIAVNDTDKNIRLQMGEINGKKTDIPLEFN